MVVTSCYALTAPLYIAQQQSAKARGSNILMLLTKQRWLLLLPGAVVSMMSLFRQDTEYTNTLMRSTLRQVSN